MNKIEQAKRQITDRVWELVNPTIDGYSTLITILMEECSPKIIRKVVRRLQTWDRCVRCSSELDEEGRRCTDDTCPFSSCDQEDKRGWQGHPDRDPHYRDDE